MENQFFDTNAVQTEAQNSALKQENAEIKADISQATRLIKQLLSDVGLMKDGEFIIKADPHTGEVKVPFSTISKILFKSLKGDLAEKFSYINQLGPLLEKYKDLQ